MTKTSPDSELVEECRRHKGKSFAAFRILVERYEPLVYRVALRYLSASELAEDITQETFLKAYNQIERLNNSALFKPWLLTIAKNLCLDDLRSQSKIPMIESNLELENLAQAPQHEADPLDEVIFNLQKLSPEEQDLLSLHYMGELSVSELAEHLEIGESAVKMRLLRAREKLEKMMAK